MTPEALTRLVAEHFTQFPPRHAGTLGVAVSGGGDSLALLHLLQALGGHGLRVVTVDHALRPEAAQEAAMVSRVCADLGLAHDVVTWSGWDGQGNLSARAREARYDLMRDWALQHDVRDLVLGHTAEDQAETVLMRLARRAGVDGLSGMAARRDLWGVTLHRPLLAARRADLRSYLRGIGAMWVDDPSNADGTSRRVQARRALEVLEPLGLSVEALCDVAGNLSQVRDAIAAEAALGAQAQCRFDRGDVLINAVALLDRGPEIARRILGGSLRWITGAQYAPRGADMTRALERIAAGSGFTLAGCHISLKGEEMRMTREYAAAARAAPSAGGVWDNRWTVPPAPEGAAWRALGPEGRRMTPQWRESGLPRASIEATPALWRGAQVLAVPMARAEEVPPTHGEPLISLCRSAPELRSLILSH